MMLNRFSGCAIAAGVCLMTFCAGVGFGQEVATENLLTLDEGARSPPAKVSDMGFIAGAWTGEAMGGKFQETWNEPEGDSMIGMFKLVDGGKLQFSEIMSIVPAGDSILLRIKHFDAQFQGWEEKDLSVDFPLVKLTENEACFDGLTFRRTGRDRLQIFVLVEGEDGDNREIEFAATLRPDANAQVVPPVAQAVGIGKSIDRQAVLKEIDEYVQKVQRDWNVPGVAIAIVQGGDVLMAKGYGVLELNKPGAVDADSLFAIASNSKAFTAASLAILVDEGKISWDDPVTKYLPEFQMPDAFITNQMTIRDLLCHRSGMDTFSGDLLWYDTSYPADDVIRRIRYLKPVSSFRSKYGYQNLMFIVAGKVIEKVSGKDWGTFVAEKILKPVGMQRTTTSVKGLSNNYALPHNESGGNGLRALPPGDVDNSWGACGLNASVNDMARWMQMQLAGGEIDGNRVLSKDRLHEMWQQWMTIPMSPGAIEADPAKHFQGYGLGYFLHDWHGRKVVSHGGGLDGMISQLAMVPEEGLGVIVLTNSESSASRFIRDRVLECFMGVEQRPDRSAEAVLAQAKSDQAEAAAREKINAMRKGDALPMIPLADFAGVYRSEMYGDVTISFENEKLILRMGPAANFVADLEHWQFNSFQIRWRDSVKYNFPRGFVNFTIDATGKPMQMVIDQPNNDFWFYELELFRVEPDETK